ncbi:hypothetical protein, partial [Mycobacterium sp.]|uniref:hypothetical protein n=1 Tax=Mycobacterium sp. TaxID=1785 RepID=UPI0025F315D5
MRIGSVIYVAAAGSPWLTPVSRPGARVDDAAQRLDQENYVIAEPSGNRYELDSARTPLLGDGTAIRVQET